ncbi:MAG: hypothetical protein ACI9RZ_001532 [Sphingobacteriales bacterium]|jgi:hypothetical protein
MKREQLDSSAFFIVYGLRNIIKQDGNHNNPRPPTVSLVLFKYIPFNGAIAGLKESFFTKNI